VARLIENFPYARIDVGAFAFNAEGNLTFKTAFFRVESSPALAFFLDVYAADDHSHPGGHAGWWKYSLNDRPETEIEVDISTFGGMLSVRFNGYDAGSSWLNSDFFCAERRLIMHLVLREEISSAIVFEDIVLLFPAPTTVPPATNGSYLYDIPDEAPKRGFVLPSGVIVHLVFASLKSSGISLLCSQMLDLLSSNEVPCRVYAGEYLPEQRVWMSPTPYLQHTVQRTDLIFYVYDGTDPYMPLVAGLPGGKLLYLRSRPDYRRFQAFDAEVARRMQRGFKDLIHLLAFDGICGESKTVVDEAAENLYTVLCGNLKKNNNASCESSIYVFEKETITFNNVNMYLARRNMTLTRGFHKEHIFPDIDSQDIYTNVGKELLTYSKRCTEELLLLPLQWKEKNTTLIDKYHFDRSAMDKLMPSRIGAFSPLLWRDNKDDVEDACDVPTRFILCVGSFRPDRHYECALEIFACVAREETDLGLVLAGRASINGYWDYLQFLRSYSYAELKDRIVYMLDCSAGQLRWLYRKASLFLSAGSYGGFSASLAEALACDLPVIARYNGNPYCAAAGLRFYAESETADIARDTLRLLRDKELRAGVVAEQRANLRHKKTDAPARIFWRVLEEALGLKKHLHTVAADEERGRG
jgi:glycosyltransferase involved in cell wall biosynthesis